MLRVRIFGLILIGLLMSGLLLAACGDEQYRQNPREDYKKAIAATGFLPGPPEQNAPPPVGFNLVLSGGWVDKVGPKEADGKGKLVYFPTLKTPPSVIELTLINFGQSDVYTSTCDGLWLRRKESTPNGDRWRPIALVRRCGSAPPKIALPKNEQSNVSFEFAKAYVQPGESWEIDGEYDLILIYSDTCPDGKFDFESCENKKWYNSNSFLLRSQNLQAFFDAQNGTPTPKSGK